jgi:hypothetical protein
LTLDTYSHVLPTMQESATNKLEKMMFGRWHFQIRIKKVILKSVS